MHYLITGTAGFIGFHLAKTLLDQGNVVIGIDNLNDYYSVELKQARHNILKQYAHFKEYIIDLCDYDKLQHCVKTTNPEAICHLAAQAGVLYSFKNPLAYQRSNLEGFCNIIEISRQIGLNKFVYASSSSVYGGSSDLPYTETQDVNKPISLYAATKRCNELLAYTYTHMYNMQTIGLRFFTVYGPWGRPDMALWKFADAIVLDKKVPLFNYGKNDRDFTYIDDIIRGIQAVFTTNIHNQFEIFNLGNNRLENICTFVEYIEKNLQKKAKIELVPPQIGDIAQSLADIRHANEILGYKPTTNIEQGIASFIQWYKEQEQIVRPIREKR
ncbi:MAG: GDP-mannose 4,6-dehydratase [Planctomycetes bacterium]|jgi:UDP-glucuronate 4-epimerase|nr:GDP-mannose 4,6-dehydratase [Planctomycetota bacterium]